MAYKIVNNNEIEKQYKKYVTSKKVDENLLDDNYKILRKACLEKYFAIKESVKNNKQFHSWKHQLDLEFGLFLYDFLNSQVDFNQKYESNYSFWKYFAVFVIPDIISDRWDIDKEDHFYDKATAVYPFQVYWYIHLSWQGSSQDTYEILKNNQEDQILQLVDRASTIGINLSLYRCIMKRAAQIPVAERQDRFRAVMLRNTSRLISTRPELYNSVDEYVDLLFKQ